MDPGNMDGSLSDPPAEEIGPASSADSPSRPAPSSSPAPALATPLRPPWPLAKRLNRNALTVAAALAGVTVLTVIVVTNPSRSTSGSSGGPPAAGADATAPIPARPMFLDQPPRTPASVPAPHQDTVAVVSKPPSAAAGTRAMSGLPVPPMLPTTDVGAGGFAADSESENGMYGGNGSGYGAPRSGPGAPSARAQAYQAALTSSVLVGNLAHGPAPTAVASRESRETSAALVRLEERTTGEPTAGEPTPGEPTPGESRSRDLADAARFDSAGSPYTVRAGTLIPGLLLTGVNSDLPGAVLGQTSRDVFDSRTERVLLIPKGSRLIGTYDNRSVGTGRLVVVWVRLILPDGRSLVLPKVAATDERGQAGLHDEVDHHFGRVYGAAVLTSVLSAGVQLSQPQQAGLYAAPSARQVAAGALGQNLGDVSLETARRGLDVPPTIVIRPGQPFNVFLSSDVSFDGPYEASPFDAAGRSSRTASAR